MLGVKSGTHFHNYRKMLQFSIILLYIYCIINVFNTQKNQDYGKQILNNLCSFFIFSIFLE